MKIHATQADAYQLMHEGALALARAERQGIRVDTAYCARKQRSLTRQIDLLRQKVEDSRFYRRWKHMYGAKANISSNHQLSRLLYKAMKIEPPKQTETGQGATDDEALRQIDLPELQWILEIRRLTKLRDTYLNAFVQEAYDGYIHPSFNLHTVRTFRSSSSDPNFQNIPKRDKDSMRTCRRALLPRPGHMFVEADFAALEVNISACYHKDPVMIRYLKDKKSDMHLDMAKQIFMFDELDRGLPAHNTLRQAAKNGFVFPQFYGDYYGNNAAGICEWVKLPREKWQAGQGIELPDGSHISDHFRSHKIGSFEQFKDHLQFVEQDFWGRRFRVYDNWRKASVEAYRRKGFLQMLTGFVCSGVMKKNEITNYPIQGTAFHCLLKTFIELDRIMLTQKWDSKLVGQIHDSIIMDVLPGELPRIREALQWIVKEHLPSVWDWIAVPLEIEIEEYVVDGPWLRG